MSKKEEAKIAMFGLTAIFLTHNEAEFTGFARLVNEIANFKSLYAGLSPSIAVQSKITTGITGDKTNAFATLEKLTVKTARKALVWANDTNHQRMAAVFNITASSFANQTQPKVIIMAKGIVDGLTENLTALGAYNITAADIAAIQAAIAACEGLVMAPGTAANSKKTATTAIKKTIAAIVGSLAIIDDLLINEYTDTKAGLADEYRNNRRIDETGVRHTGISATITDAATGNAIESATIAIDALNKTGISEMDGLAEITPMMPGSYHVRFAAPGYLLQLQDITVGKGKMVEVAVEMVKE